MCQEKERFAFSTPITLTQKNNFWSTPVFKKWLRPCIVEVFYKRSFMFTLRKFHTVQNAMRLRCGFPKTLLLLIIFHANGKRF